MATTVLAIALAAPPRMLAQTSSTAASDEREQAFVESLRRDDAAAADRYVALRDARGKAIAELERAETQYRAAGLELRSAFLPPLRQARRNYAAASLALLDFFDGRDREAVSRYQEEIVRINGILEERKRRRAEYERLLKE